MYKNLAKILSEKRITMKAFAEFLGVAEKTAQNKVYGRTDFTLGEVMKTCTIICPEYKLDYVFEKTETLEEGAPLTGAEEGVLAAATA